MCEQDGGTYSESGKEALREKDKISFIEMAKELFDQPANKKQEADVIQHESNVTPVLYNNYANENFFGNNSTSLHDKYFIMPSPAQNNSFNLSPYATGTGHSEKHPNIKRNDYPYKLLPPVIRNVVSFLNDKYGLPHEISSNVILSALAIACQPLFEVAATEADTPETCSLYLMTIAKSGAGKSLAYEKIMKPFLSLYGDLERVYDKNQREYIAKHELWAGTNKEIRKEHRKLARNDPMRKILEQESIEHKHNEPIAPKRLFSQYEDVTEAGLKNGLSDSIHGAILTEEGEVFLEGYAKNSVGIYNLLWDGAGVSHKRSKSGHERIMSSLSINILVQNEIFDEYLIKNHKKAKGSGYLPRFLFVHNGNIDSVIKENAIPGRDNRARSLTVLLCSLSRLVKLQKKKFHNFCQNENNDKAYKKDLILLSSEANECLKQRLADFSQRSTTGGKWEHIQSSVLKAREHIIRLSGVLQSIFVFHKNKNIDISRIIVDKSTIEHSSKLVEWYLDEASRILGPVKNSNKLGQEPDHVYLWNFLRQLPHSCRDVRYPIYLLSKNKVLKYTKFSGKSERLNNALMLLIQKTLIAVGPIGRATFIIVNPNVLNNEIE